MNYAALCRRADRLAPAGYIATDSDSSFIHGIGHDEASAKADAEHTLIRARYDILDAYPEDAHERPGSFIMRDDILAWPATAALLQAVEDHGGSGPYGWTVVKGVAMLADEDDAP